jgi:hypothetical protein
LPSARLRSQLLPVGAPAGACPRCHLLTGRPWRLVEASCTLGPALCTALVPSLPRPPVDGTILSSRAGGIRTHDLELMRLARTAAPLPRKSGRQESNLRSPAPEAGGVANSPTARRSFSTPGGTRTRSFRVEGPASSPVRPRGHEKGSSGGRARTCLSRVTVARLADSTTPERSGRRGSRTPKARGGPPVFETGYRAGGSPSEVKWPRQASNLQPSA